MPHPSLSRRRVVRAVLSLLPALPAAVAAQPEVPAQMLSFKRGATEAAVSGRLAGPDQDVRDHVFRARGGQTLTVTLATSSSSAHFNLLPPESEEALFRGEVENTSRWEGTLPADGAYRVRVFLNRAAARRHATADYTLTVTLR